MVFPYSHLRRRKEGGGCEKEIKDAAKQRQVRSKRGQERGMKRHEHAFRQSCRLMNG